MEWIAKLTDMQGLMLFGLAAFVVVYLVMYNSRPAIQVGLGKYFQPNVWTGIFWVSGIVLIGLIGGLVSLYLMQNHRLTTLVNEQWKNLPGQMCNQVKGCTSATAKFDYDQESKAFIYTVALKGSKYDLDTTIAQALYQKAVNELPWQLEYTLADEPKFTVALATKKGGKK